MSFTPPCLQLANQPYFSSFLYFYLSFPLSHNVGFVVFFFLFSSFNLTGRVKISSSKYLKESFMSQIVLCSFFPFSFFSYYCFINAYKKTCKYNLTGPFNVVHSICFRGDNLTTEYHLGGSSQEKIYSHLPPNSQ